MLDLPTFADFLASVVCLLLALQWGGPRYSWRTAHVIVLFVVFGLLIVVFAAMEIREKVEALVPLSFISWRSTAFETFSHLWRRDYSTILRKFVLSEFRALHQTFVNSYQSGFKRSSHYQ